MSALATLFTSTGLPRYRQPRHARQTVAPVSSYTLQRSMLGSSMTYDTEESPHNSRTDLLAVFAASSSQSFGSLAGETMVIEREESSTPSETMSSWLKLDLGSLTLSDSVVDEQDGSATAANSRVLAITTEINQLRLGTRTLSEAQQYRQTSQRRTEAGNHPSAINPFEGGSTEIPKALSMSGQAGARNEPGMFLRRRPVDIVEIAAPSAVGSAIKSENRDISGVRSTPITDHKRNHIRPLAKEEVPRTYLRDSSVKLPKGHPFTSSISSLFQETSQGGADQSKLLSPTPPLAKLEETMSAFPSDHYPNAMLGRLANDQSMVIDDIMDGSFPPKRLVSHHQPSDSFLSFSTHSPSPIAVSDPSPSTPITIKTQPVRSSRENRPRSRLRPRSRNNQQTTTRDQTKPKRAPRDRRRPSPLPRISGTCSSSGSEAKKYTSSDITMRSPRNHRDSVDLIRARVSDGERKAKIPRLSRHARAISLHDELFPTCLPSFPARPTARLLLGGTSSQVSQNDDGHLAEQRPNTLVMSHNNSSRLSITLRDLRHPIQRIFRSQSRHSDSQQDQENVGPTPAVAGPLDVDHSGETLFTRPSSHLAQRGTGFWFCKRKTPQTVYKPGYEPQEHFASIRGCGPAPVSEETQRCRDFPTMDSVVVGRVTGMDFTEFKAEEAARVAKMNEEANSFKGHLKRKMSQIRSLSWGNDWREDQHMAMF